MTPRWWAEHFAWASQRAGGMPPEVAEPQGVKLSRVKDPETGDPYAKVTITLPPGTTQGRTRELAHMLTSVLACEGFTMRGDGEKLEDLPGEEVELTGEIGELGYATARVCAGRCMSCIFSTDSRIGCCGQGSAFSLTDIGAALLTGGEQLVAEVLALPGEMDAGKWQPYLRGGACVYHDPSKGCTLPPNRMPLQCRTYLCMPELLLPSDLAASYEDYIDQLEEMEEFIDQHMREQGVGFQSPPEALKRAAEKAFAAWEQRRDA